MHLAPATQPAAPASESGSADLPPSTDRQARISGEDMYLAVAVGFGLVSWIVAILIVMTSSLAH